MSETTDKSKQPLNIREIGKKQVDYKRQIEFFGQEAADNVLGFWLLGHAFADEQTKPLKDEIEEKTKALRYCHGKLALAYNRITELESSLSLAKKENEELKVKVSDLECDVRDRFTKEGILNLELTSVKEQNEKLADALEKISNWPIGESYGFDLRYYASEALTNYKQTKN